MRMEGKRHNFEKIKNKIETKLMDKKICIFILLNRGKLDRHKRLVVSTHAYTHTNTHSQFGCKNLNFRILKIFLGDFSSNRN